MNKREKQLKKEMSYVTTNRKKERERQSEKERDRERRKQKKLGHFLNNANLGRWQQGVTFTKDSLFYF